MQPKFILFIAESQGLDLAMSQEKQEQRRGRQCLLSLSLGGSVLC